MTKEELAERLDGREYRSEITKDEQMAAKAAGLIVVFGASDDLMELRGSIHDEECCYGGGTVLVDAQGIVDRDRVDVEDDDALADYLARKKVARKIEALWCKEPGYSWTYRTDIPHATFEIVEDGEPYCRGIVFSLADLEAK